MLLKFSGHMERNKELKVQAVVFDLDGLLIDSEPQWQAAEVEVFGALGVPLTPEMCRQTVGLRIEEAVGYWRVRYPWGEPEDNIVADRVVARMLELITSAGEPMPGAVDAVRVIHDHGIPAAVATSSRH